MSETYHITSPLAPRLSSSSLSPLHDFVLPFYRCMARALLTLICARVCLKSNYILRVFFSRYQVHEEMREASENERKRKKKKTKKRNENEIPEERRQFSTWIERKPIDGNRQAKREKHSHSFSVQRSRGKSDFASITMSNLNIYKQCAHVQTLVEFIVQLNRSDA